LQEVGCESSDPRRVTLIVFKGEVEKIEQIVAMSYREGAEMVDSCLK
jgi:hypothetical protein